MGKKENATELARERANNLVRAVEAAKSSRHSLSLVNMYAGHVAGELAPAMDRANAAIGIIEDILRRRQAD
jgi:hypothetical protein